MIKKWKKIVPWFFAVSILAGSLAVPVPAGASGTEKSDTNVETYRDGAVVPAEKAAAVRRAARDKAMASYYITSGAKLDKVVARLLYINPEETGLVQQIDYIYRMDKALTGNYFYHLKAFHPVTSELAGDYLIARDESCVFRRFPGENRTELLDGTTDKLLEKVEIYAAYRKIPLDGAGKVFIRVPGSIPYDLTLTSLNENIVTVRTGENGQLLVYGAARGKADVLAEVEIGGFSKSRKVNFIVMDEKDIEREENRSSGSGFPIGIGIGFGWGRGRHHHGHGGGVVIGI